MGAVKTNKAVMKTNVKIFHCVKQSTPSGMSLRGYASLEPVYDKEDASKEEYFCQISIVNSLTTCF